jgi:hypothetical protein
VLVTEPDLPDDAAAMVARTRTGDCVFYHRHSGLCVVHRDLGEAMLPATCRHFPRLAVRDWRGTSLSLTHYCPTAAAMLFRDDVPLEIVESPPAFPAADYEGLKVDPEAWPPLLHPGILMDVEGYAAWERHMVRRCADARLSPEQVIAALEDDARALRAWGPADGSLASAVAALSARSRVVGQTLRVCQASLKGVRHVRSAPRSNVTTKFATRFLTISGRIEMAKASMWPSRYVLRRNGTALRVRCATISRRRRSPTGRRTRGAAS